MRRKRATEFVTSDEMTLHKFYGAILLFQNENQYLFVFLIKIILKKVFEYVINRLKHGTLFIALSINPRPLSALELTLSDLIIGSRVDTAGDNQSLNVIISNYWIELTLERPNGAYL